MSGNVIDHIVKHQVIVFCNGLYIIPVAEGRIHFLIFHRCKAPVSGRWKEGKDMDTAHSFRKIGIQYFF